MKIHMNAAERSRLETRSSYQILDTAPEAAFDDLAHLAAQICATPIATITLVDEHRQRFKARLELPMRETDRVLAFCDYAIHGTTLLTIPDLHKDPRFAKNPFVLNEPTIRFYAGAPLVVPSGEIVGTLSVMDYEPRALTPGQLDSLQRLARQVVDQFELRLSNHKQTLALITQKEAEAELRRQTEHLESAQHLAHIGSWEMIVSEERLQWSEEVYHIFGITPSETPVTFDAFISSVHSEDRPAMLAASENALAGGPPLNFEHRIIWSSGEVRHVHERAQLFVSTDGVSKWLAGTVQDITEQKRIHRQVESFFDLSIALLGIASLEGRFTKVNHAFRRVLDRSAEELTSAPFIEFVHSDDQAATQAVIENFSTAHLPLHFQCRCLTSGGSYRLISWSALAVPEEAVVYCIGRDITEANEAREALAASEARYRSLVESSQDLIWAVDAQGIITFINQAAHQIYGRAPEEMIGHSFLSFTSAEQASIDSRAISQTVLTGAGSENYSTRVSRPDGSVVQLRVNYVVARDATGQTIGVTGISRDVTFQMEAEEALRQSEEHFRHFFFSAAAGISTYELDGRIIQFNPAFAAIMDYHQDESPEINLFALFDPDDYPKSRELVRQLSLGEIDSFSIEKLYLKESGGTAWVRASVSCVPPSANMPQYIIAIAADISRQKVAEEKLKESESLLRIAGRIARLGAWSYEPSASHVVWSDEVCAIHEVSPSFSATVAEAIDFYASEYRETIRTAFGLCVSEGIPFDVELEIITALGNRRWVQAIGEAKWNDNDIIVRVHGTLQDITDKKQAETEFRQLATRLSTILESITDAFVAIDYEWRFTYVNQEAELLLQRSRNELLGRSFWDEFPHAPGDSANPEYKRAVQENVTVAFEAFNESLGKWLDVRAFPSSEGLTIYFRDITEQMRAREALQTSEERFKTIARATQDVIWDTNMTTNTEWWSEGVEQSFGYSHEELEQAPGAWTRHMHAEDQAWVRKSIAAWVEGAGDNSWTGEYRILRKDGSVAYVFERAFLTRDGDGSPVRMVGSILDLTERKQAEEALRASEERFRQMAEAIEDVFWIYDPELNRILYASPQYETIFVDSREALYQDPRSYQRYIHPDDLPQLQAAAERDIYSIHTDYRLLLPGGEIRWVNVRTYPVQDATGKVIYTVGIGRDVTLFKQIAEQLQASEAQYRLIFTDNPQPMWVYDSHTLQFQAVNEAAVGHYGYSEEEFLAMGLDDIRPPAENKLQDARLKATEQEGKPHIQILWRHRKKDGTLIDVEASSSIIEFNGRKAQIALLNDVTAHLYAEAQVREQAALLDVAQDAIIVRDLDHRITYWNRSAERLYGWSAAEVLGRRADELLHKDKNYFNKAHQQVIETGEWSGELVKADRSGRELLIEGRWTLVRDEAGNPRAILVTNTDISERKKLEAQYLRAQRMESIGTLAGGIAHDLNNVLAPILLSLGMLKQQTRSDKELKLLSMLETSAKHGADMVRQVLYFARGVDGEHTVVDIAQIVRGVQLLVRDTFDRNIRVQVHVDDGLPAVMADPTQIHQLLLNLAVNARDAMPRGGRLELAASAVTLDAQYSAMNQGTAPGEYVRLRVSDSGTGIPAAILDRIFDPFFTTKEVGKGTGLGLANVQAVVKSHGGFISAYSEEGRGTQFMVYLPAFGGDLPHDPPPTPEISVRQGHGELILVVDDDTTVRLVTEQTLEAFGYRVLSAEDGAEAVAVYVQYRHEIAAVLTDMMMPVMDGFATIHALRKINPDVKIIAASGLTANGVVSKAVNANVKHFLEKPYTTEAMLKVFAETLAEDTSEQ